MTERLKVLVVDDEPVVLGSTRKILASEHFEVLTASNAEEALMIVEAQAPHIVVSDLVLPGVSGMNLLDAALEQDPALVVIITTGYSTVENAVAALKHGAFDFLPKPFTCDELLSVVSRARHAVERRLTLGARGLAKGPRGDFLLGVQTWARPERDGTVLLGVTALQMQTLDRVEAIDLPEPGAELRQGGRLVSLRTADGLTHTLWSPLGGRVLARNEVLAETPDALGDDSRSGGYVARIRPSDLDGELPDLVEC